MVLTPLERHLKASAIWACRKISAKYKPETLITDTRYIMWPVVIDCIHDTVVYDKQEKRFIRLEYLYRDAKGKLSVKHLDL